MKIISPFKIEKCIECDGIGLCQSYANTDYICPTCNKKGYVRHFRNIIYKNRIKQKT